MSTQSARMRNVASLLASLCMLACGPGVVVAGQIDTGTFNLLSRGMSESEILVRAGAPDLDVPIGATSAERTTIIDEEGETVQVFTRKSVAHVRELHYIPGDHEHDPHLTIITITGGRVSDIRRTKVFTRHKQQSSFVPGRRSDPTLMVERAERTLRAARAYTAIRSGLTAKAALDAHHSGGSATVYRAVEADGSVYFGDRPLQ